MDDGGDGTRSIPDELTPGIAALGEALAIAVVGLDGRMFYVSPLMCEVTEGSRSELLGRRWADIVHPEDREGVRAAWQAARDGGGAAAEVVLEWRLASGDGPDAWLESRVAPLVVEGETVGWAVASLEITERKLSERQVAASERRLQKIVESTSDLVTVLRADGSWQWSSNDGILGRRADLAPDEAFSVVHPDDRERLVRTFERARERGAAGPDARVHQYRAQAMDGSWRWLETTAANLLEDPDVGGIVLHSRDVTEHHRTIEELRAVTGRLESLVSHLTVGVAMVDADGHNRIVNRAYADPCGFRSPEQMVGGAEEPVSEEQLVRFADLVDDLDAHLRERRRIVEAGVTVVDDPVHLRDGRTFGRTFIPISVDGAPAGHLWLYRDMTSELAAVEERERMLTVQMEQNRKLTELDTAKSDLIAAISHELRTPIASVIGFAQLLRDGVGQDSVEEQREFVEVIVRNTSRQLRLVDDLLMIDRIDTRQLSIEREPIDVAELVRMAVSSRIPTAEQQGVVLTSSCAPGPSLDGDRDRLGQLLDNLLTNAVKFTPEGGTVDVTARRRPHAWELTVTDEGVGVPDHEREELFRRFFRGSNVRRQAIPGSGLGLTIVKGIIDLHGGSVEIDSQEGKGTRVTVVLPDTAAQSCLAI